MLFDINLSLWLWIPCVAGVSPKSIALLSMEHYGNLEQRLVTEFLSCCAFPLSPGVVNKLNDGILHWLERRHPRKGSRYMPTNSSATWYPCRSHIHISCLGAIYDTKSRGSRWCKNSDASYWGHTWHVWISTTVLETRGQMLTALGHGLWPGLVIFSEIVQTFILADFCYYYVKSIISSQHVLRLPAGVV
ncbi:hypothetical protein POM88_045077 [Heracleum sosnowskyi]|uniref:Uncharacterized protein n=1 Tax=Heracleum sosnowskyi TaxID=360622 RepID=A0AAD8M622_9APIA|nr:hypothetical protein POM88_045077 [Heracleum sosnowskyi]